MLVFKQQTDKIEFINNLWPLLTSYVVGVDCSSLSRGRLLTRAEVGSWAVVELVAPSPP